MTAFPSVGTLLSAAVRQVLARLRPYQQKGYDEIHAAWAAGHANVLAVFPTGAGKCLGRGTPVLMFDGSIRPVEEIRVGDLLMGPDSRPRKVESLAFGVENLYRVEPSKGEAYVVNESHILSLRITGTSDPISCADGKKYVSGEVANVNVLDYLASSKTFKHVAKGWRTGVEFSAHAAPCPVDPYVLGAWLGDGTEARGVCLTNIDEPVLDAWRQWAAQLNCTVRFEPQSHSDCGMHFIVNRKGERNPALERLREIGVHGCRHLPDRYKTGSREERLELLAGIIDTDGYLTNGGYDLVQKSKRFADDIAYLCRSLGLAAYVSECSRQCVNTGAWGDYWRISISGETSSIPCRVGRRKAGLRKQKKNVLRTGISVEPIGPGEYFGFEVSGTDRLFLLGDFTVTHNTVLMAAITATHTGGAVLIAHREELVAQIALALNNAGVRYRLICPKATRQEIIARVLRESTGPLLYDANALVGVGGVDTLVNIDKRPELAAWAASVTLWITDEAHHVLPDNKWGRAISKFTAEGILGLGPTATPCRTDGRGLGRHADGLFDFMVIGPSMRELIEQGFLSPYRVWTVPCSVHYDEIPVGASGDFIQAKLVAAEEADDRLVGDIVANYQKRAPGKRAVCFVSSVKKAEEVAERFRSAGFTAQAVDGKTDKAIRAQAMRDLESGALNVLVNCDLIGEGVDIPAVEVVILGTATASFIRFSQWWGRGLRLMLNALERRGYNELAPEQRRAVIAGSVKPFAMIFDHGSNVIRHNGPPDTPQVWTLDRREGRGSGSGEVAPYRICANKGYSEPRGGWEKWRAAGWTVKQMEEHGHISLSTDAIPCAQPYERIHKACPYCGFMPDPQSRRDIEHVEGDLQELDEETLNAIRSQVAEANRTVDEYREYMASTKVNGLAQMANVKRHAERLAELEELRQIMGHWGGYWRLQGDNDSQLQRRFFHYYGIDVLSAQALKRQEAETLKWRILTSLSRLGIVGLPTTVGEQK